VKINLHGVVGLLSIGAMIGICIYKNWEIPWLYVLLGSLAYLLMILATSNRQSFPDKNLGVKLAWGSHLSYLLLAGGLLINARNFWEYVAIFVSAISIGLAIPFMLIRED